MLSLCPLEFLIQNLDVEVVGNCGFGERNRGDGFWVCEMRHNKYKKSTAAK